MTKNKSALIKSLIALMLSVSMLVGTTFAWFTDNISSGNNIIVSGNIDVEMYWTDDLDNGTWHNVEDPDYNTIFSYDNWEPGYTDVKYIKIKNSGSLALNYKLAITPETAVGKLAEVINVHYATDGIKINDRTDLQNMATLGLLSNVLRDDHVIKGTLMADGQQNPYHPNSEVVLTLAMTMITTAGNDYQNETAGSFGITALASQAPFEEDSFGANYDSAAELPIILSGDTVSAEVENVNGAAAKDVTLQGVGVSATLPAGTLLEDGADRVTLMVTPLEKTTSDITVVNNEILIPVDVHVDGVSEDNTTPIVVNLGQILPKGLNMGNYTLYHVEDGTNKVMTLVNSAADLSAHNTFTYDPVTGEVSVAMASFSEVAIVADTEAGWKGNYDYSWYTNSKARTETTTEYTIANADQLAAFGQIVGGMAEDIDRDSFEDKTVKLLADINLADGESKNNNVAKIFHPIGYYYKDGDSTVKSFEGTFDGMGHTISNFYQNTWEIKGDYDGTYYKDAMGLFGYVYGGTVKNLTVDNFSSDGEYTPTGVIAAFADGNSTFENIAITKCNPRVYNTGNGGIIGIAGDTSAANDDHITLKNITVDNSNKISALWGSWDVACGGLVGMYRGNVDGSGNATGDTIGFENCHVAAIIDVYNDVCANYQYYAYRYAGMIIGSVRHNTKNAEGKTIPNMTGISATGCTVNYGDWNDYYYCEFEKNTMASYSEDYQFSRVPHSELKFTDSNGNGVVDADERASVTGCKHTHTAEENHQAIYLPFHQLFTGYSWGVSSIGLEELEGIENITVSVGKEESEFKFKANLESFKDIRINDEIKIGTLFSAVDGANINGSAVQVSVSALDGNGITAEYKANADNWANGTIKFNEVEGLCSISIQDYNFCKPTTVILFDGKPYDIFKKTFKGDFLYRVGNQNEISLCSLFGATSIAINSSTVKVTVGGLNGYAYTPNYSDWSKGTLQFHNTGVATVTIQDTRYANVTTLKLEVVDGVNATAATNATKNNVVLLNDCGFSSLEVSAGYTLYGNGFTMTCGSDSAALDMGYSFVTLNNGTLDNVQIVTPNFDYAVLYKSNMTESGNRKETTDKTRYFNVKSGVMASGNSQILNSRISGGRAALNVSGGNVVVDNSRIELGAVASILVGSANSLTLRDVTLVQKPTASTYDSSKTLMGFSVLYLCDSEGKATPTTLEGSFVQQAWVNADDKKYVPSAGQDIVDGVMKETAFIHNIDGKDSLNLGFAYMPEDAQKTVDAPDNITDNRTDKATVPYEMKDVNIQISILSTTVYVYSYKNTNGTADSFKTESEYIPNKYSDIITVTYSDTADGLTTGKSFGTDGWVYELNVDLDKLSGYALDFSKLSMTVNGKTVTDFKVNKNAKPTSPVAVTAGGTTYTLTTTIDGKEYTANYKVTGTETSKESPSLVASNYEAGLCVASSYGGTWHGAAPALEGIQIKYWSVAEKQYKTINLSDYTPTTAGKQNGTNTTWTYSPANGDFTLTLTGGQVHSGNSVNAMPVVCDGKLYFVAASSKGLVNSGNSARTIPVSYSFKDNNNGDVLTFSHTWSVEENKDAQYNYSDFCNGTLTKLEASSGGGCVTPDTLITLADGTKVRVDSLKGDEELLVWNLETGKLDKAPIMFVDSDPTAEYEVIKLRFSDGTEVKVISEHGFWDYDLNKYVYLDRNAADYIGHTFAKKSGDGLKKIVLTDVVIETEVTTAWSPVTVGHLCYFTNDMLSMPGGVGGLFNIFEVDAETMTYDYEAIARDIETYGLFTYEEISAIAPLSEEMFYAAGGQYLKVSIGKGNLTEDELAAMITRYSKYI